jgi:hypothetical protein
LANKKRKVVRRPVNVNDQTGYSDIGFAQQHSPICRALKEKPKRTHAEEHDYDRAKKALEQFGPRAYIALRHLRAQGSLAFGTYSPPLPEGVNGNETVWGYDTCVAEGLVSRSDSTPKQGEATFRIGPKMDNILEELLFEGNTKV